jgi:hypothetical protein
MESILKKESLKKESSNHVNILITDVTNYINPYDSSKGELLILQTAEHQYVCKQEVRGHLYT